MNIRATQNAFSLALVSSTTRISESVSNVWQCASSCSSISGVNALSFAGRLITKVAMKPLRWRSMVPLFMVTSLLKIVGIH